MQSKNRLKLVGKRYGRLLVQHEVGTSHKKSVWSCLCDCGNLIVAAGYLLRRGGVKSCGCFAIERTKEANTTHGKKGTKVYSSWSAMMTRCNNPRSRDYRRYGAKGIKVCARWRDFRYFYADMGDPPSSRHSIHRKNNAKGYFKSNCCWATPAMQAQCRTNTRSLTVNGVTRTTHQWAKISGVPSSLILTRVRRLGWPHKDAVFTPAMMQYNRYS